MTIPWEVWFRKVGDGRAPSQVNLEADYNRIGEFKAESRRLLEQQLALVQDPYAQAVDARRRIHIGDVVIDKTTGAAFIYTPIGAWASVVVSG
jgi:hypothetical protein